MLGVSNVENINDLNQIVNERFQNIIDFFAGLIPNLLDFGMKVIYSLIIYFIGSRLIKVVRKAMRRFFERADVDEGAKQFIDSFVKYILYFFLAVVISTQFGVTSASVVALLGSAGLAVVLALQGSLSNFAGGVLILLIKPFKVGDYIIEGSQKNEGTVTEIQIFYTVLTTGDNKTIMLPNGTLMNNSLMNVTHLDKRRLDITVSISYQEDIRNVKELLTKVLSEESRHIPEDGITVFVESLEENYIKLICRIWVRTEDYFDVKCHLVEEIKCQLDREKIKTPYNQLDVFIKNNLLH